VVAEQLFAVVTRFLEEPAAAETLMRYDYPFVRCATARSGPPLLQWL
jgi:hypothetical protein